MKFVLWVIVGAAIVILLLLPESLFGQLSEDSEFCLECHGDSTMEMELPNGETMSIYVDPQEFLSSVHGDKLNCTDCHSNISDYPHPEVNLKNQRAYSMALYESCKRCHFANYTKTLESIHYRMLSAGDTRAPVCVDCHGAHNISRPDLPRARISRTCEGCHEKIYATYIQSVHGKALTEGNPDVPTCTDCHRAHDIQEAHVDAFIVRTPTLCGNCHANEKLMSKYGLSTDVLRTYLQDFHGVSISFYSRQGGEINAGKAVCTDCHGVHDITKVRDSNSSVLKENLLKNCQKCHPKASVNFPDTWLPHYEPSPTKAALVYYVKLFYKIFIPFTIGGLLLHILLHIWRVAINR